MHSPSSPDPSCRPPRAVRVRRSSRVRAAVALLACAAVPVAGAQQPPQPQQATRTPDVIYVPTPFETIDRMLAVARVGRNDLLFDLGSGDGRIVIAAARK